MSNTYSISIETGGYRQLDLFTERCGEGNAVVTVADGNASQSRRTPCPSPNAGIISPLRCRRNPPSPWRQAAWLYASATFPNAMTCLTTAFAT